MKSTYRGLSIASGVLSVVILLLAAFGCMDIYMQGHGFSRENISARLIPLGIMAAVWLIIACAAAAIKPKDIRQTRPASGYDPSSNQKGWLRIAIIAAALILIVIGTVNGGARDVLYKAINICTECIGLG